MMRAILAAVLLAAPVPCWPQAGPTDPRLQYLDYEAGRVFQLHGAPGYQLTIALSPDEQVQNVAVGDGGAWAVSVNQAGNHLFIKPTQGEVATNMTVITSVRVYNFELFPMASPSPDMPFTVTFRFPERARQETLGEFVDVSAAQRRQSRYRIRGDRLLRPGSVSDDGRSTYIRWPEDRPIPAVFEIGADGVERTANGAMRGDDYVIDGVPGRLLFRIDGRTAGAERTAPKRSR